MLSVVLDVPNIEFPVVYNISILSDSLKERINLSLLKFEHFIKRPDQILFRDYLISIALKHILIFEAAINSI